MRARLLLPLFAASAVAQTPLPPTPSQVSPAAAYQQAMHPVELTHRSLANWSGIEQASLATAMQQAAVACAERHPADFTGDRLIDLARLCSLGLNWPAVIEATGRYLKETPKPHFTEAYAGRIDAELHLRDEAAAIKDADALLTATTDTNFDSFAAAATTEVIDYTKLLHTDAAVAVAQQRQPLLLKLLATPPAPALLSSQTPVDLYRQALALPELQQLNAQPAAAVQSFAALEKVTPATLASDDRIAIAALARRYAQLGKPLAPLNLLAPVDLAGHPATGLPHITTAFLLFPDWCAQCVRLAQAMPLEGFSIEDHPATVFGLLVQTVPPKHTPPDIHTDPSSFDPAHSADALKKTPTRLAPAALLDRFNAVDVPLLIVADSGGFVRFIDVADETAFEAGKTVDSALALVARHWPEAKTTLP